MYNADKKQYHNTHQTKEIVSIQNLKTTTRRRSRFKFKVYNRMNYFTNNIRKNTAYQRESANRTASERLLDKHYREKHQKILELEKQLGVNSQPTKKAKIQEKLESTQPAKELTPEEALSRITKHFSNHNKLNKSLELLVKLFESESLDKISHLSVFDVLLQLVQMTLTKQLEPKAYQSIKAIMTAVKNRNEAKPEGECFKEGQLQVWEVLRLMGLDISSIWTDDSFEFSRALNTLKKSIAQFDAQFQKINNLEALSELTKQQNEGEAADSKKQMEKLINGSTQQKQIFKRSLLFEMVCKLFTMGNVSWRKSAIDQFLKDFNLEQRSRILSPKFRKQFAALYQDFLNSKIKSSLASEKYNKIDKEILSTPLNSHHEVKDNRTVHLVSDGTAKWSSKQN